MMSFQICIDLSFFETQKLFQCMEKDSIFCKNFSVPQRKKPVWIYLYKNENASNISTVDCIQLYSAIGFTGYVCISVTHLWQRIIHSSHSSSEFLRRYQVDGGSIVNCNL